MKSQLKIILSTILLFFISSALVTMQSCKRAVVQVPGVITKYDNSIKINATLSGIILDESGNAIKGAAVSIGSNYTISDAQGYFNFNNVSMPQHNTTVRVTKQGYFNGYKSLSVNANQRHTISLILMKKESPETFISANGATVSFAGGLSITFPSNALVNKATGVAYSGQAYVFAKTINPTTELGRMTMPGDLRGLDATNGEEKILQSFGMFVAEIFDQNGNALQVSPTTKATISLDIPSSLSAGAKASIPLWYFDEAKEMWIEEGSATKQGNKYVGDVKHFSFWNCDQPINSVYFQMTIIDQLGNPVIGYTVKLTDPTTGDSRLGYTNSAGWVGGLTPQNATLNMEVYPTSVLCPNLIPTPIYTQTVTTAVSNINLGTIVVTTSNVTTITGTIIDCANNPISNGTALIQPGYIIVNTNSSGQFSYEIPCVPTQTITVTPYDNTAGIYGNTSSGMAIVAGLNNIGNFQACGNITPFLNVTFTNTATNTIANYTFTPPSGYIVADADAIPLSYISASDSMQGNRYLHFTANDTTNGTHTIPTFVINGILNPGWNDTQFNLATASANTVTYTSFPLAPGQVIGSFSVFLTGVPSGQTYTATGNFRAQR
jgi:hypothetical protein